MTPTEALILTLCAMVGVVMAGYLLKTPCLRALGFSSRRDFKADLCPLILLTFLLLGGARPSSAYSLLTHEELVDVVWKDQVQPLLLNRFPTATPAQLRQAHAYAYGGCLIQDIGYYPFGNKFFSDLTHYVRTGDFITNLLRESADLDQYAFALGAMAHYSADN